MGRTLFLGFVGLVVLVFAACAIYVGSRQHLEFHPPYPQVSASGDTAVIARGRYVVRNLVNCASCHGDPTRKSGGPEIPLSGGYHFDVPPGVFYARNITPDSATGIGAFSDGAVARALRYGVGNDGRALLPFMEMQGLSDEDLAAVISYLRSQPPVHNVVPPHRYNLLGMIVKATVLANPVGPKSPPPHETPHGATAENGRYLVESVALCGSCHTQRSMQTGQFTGPHLGGAKAMEAPDSLGRVWSPPNLTSDPETGRLARMSEDDFVTRFRAGRMLPDSPMPWQGFMNLADDDLRAIYRYLKTVPPVHNDVGPPVSLVKK